MSARGIAEAATECRSTGLAGWELVGYATHLVSLQFSTYSLLHPWESPAVAFRRGRGFCTQYNGALAILLNELGFRVRLVYATRVRFKDQPEWRFGHTWLRVQAGGELKDVCARSLGNTPGRVQFTPMSRVRDAGRVETLLSTLGSFGAAVCAITAARIRGKPRPEWVEHPRPPS